MKKKYLKGDSAELAARVYSKMLAYAIEFVYRVVFGNKECADYLLSVRAEVGEPMFQLLMYSMACDVFFPTKDRLEFHEKMKGNEYSDKLIPIVEKVVEILGLDSFKFEAINNINLAMPVNNNK